MLLLSSFGTYRNLPELPVRGQFGRLPDAKGDPATGDSAPVFPSMLYAPTVPSFSFVTYRNFSDRSKVIPFTSPPARTGEPEIAVNAPVALSLRKAEIWDPPAPLPQFTTYANDAAYTGSEVAGKTSA